MCKMGSHDQFGHFKHKLWPKEGPRVKLSNWQFDSRPLKVRNRPNFLMCRWCTTYHWKSLDEGYNFVSDLISIRDLHAKLWGPQSHENLNCGNFETPTWESRDKMSFRCWSHGQAQNIL
jgi:hypothetical protein